MRSRISLIALAVASSLSLQNAAGLRATVAQEETAPATQASALFARECRAALAAEIGAKLVPEPAFLSGCSAFASCTGYPYTINCSTASSGPCTGVDTSCYQQGYVQCGSTYISCNDPVPCCEPPAGCGSTCSTNRDCQLECCGSGQCLTVYECDSKPTKRCVCN